MTFIEAITHSSCGGPVHRHEKHRRRSQLPISCLVLQQPGHASRLEYRITCFGGDGDGFAESQARGLRESVADPGAAISATTLALVERQHQPRRRRGAQPPGERDVRGRDASPALHEALSAHLVAGLLHDSSVTYVGICTWHGDRTDTRMQAGLCTVLC